MSSRLPILLILGLALSFSAAWAESRPKQTIPDGPQKWILMSNGNILREDNLGGRELVDNGTGTRMIAAYRGRLFALKNNGNIWMFDGSWRKIDNGAGTPEIWVKSGRLYCRKQNQQVWCCIDAERMVWKQVG